MSLETLLRAARRGDPDAWERLGTVLPQKLHAYFRRWRPGKDTSDLVQSVIVIVLEKLPLLDSEQSLEGWLFGVARNQGREQLRAGVRRTALRKRIDELPKAAPAGPSTAMLEAQVQQMVVDEIERLPGRLREVVEHDLTGATTRALADQRGISSTTVRTQRTRAHATLGHGVRRRMQTPIAAVSKLTAVSTPTPA